jgi:hypothetical protein
VGVDRLRSNGRERERERVGEMLCNASRKVDEEHLGGPLGGEACMI